MAPIDHARIERAALCDLFLDVGPSAPTLCEGWTTRDLAAHLIIREHRPDAAIGLIVPPLAAHGEKVRVATAARPWDGLVADVRAGPPVWSPMRIAALDRATNTVEFFVHHEDVRRATDGWTPRELDADLDVQLWSTLHRMARFSMRKAPAGVVLATPDGRSVTAKESTPSVTLTGPPGELTLFTSGRQAHALVDLDGPDDLVAAMRTAQFGV
jgi:uncharacterized protein (TIGR03085 family)